MNMWEFIIAVVAIGSIAIVLLARQDGAKRSTNARVGPEPATNPDADRLRDEVKTLKDRIAVLERLATDTNRAVDLDREIDRLR